MPTSPILARADALMQRRRQNNSEIEDVPVLTDAIDANIPDPDDDIPLLLDIEQAAPVTEPAAVIEESDALSVAHDIVETPAPAAFDATLREIIAHELARRVEQRIAAELPRIIESTIRDYLREQEMIDRLQPGD